MDENCLSYSHWCTGNCLVFSEFERNNMKELQNEYHAQLEMIQEHLMRKL